VKNPMFGKSRSLETKAKISATKGTSIYIYDSQGIFVNTFPSARKAAEFFNCGFPTILKHAKDGKLFKNQWVLSTSSNSEL